MYQDAVKSAVKTLICLGALGAMASCSPPPIDISVERAAGRTVLVFSQDWGLLAGNEPPCIDRIIVLRDKTYDYDNPVWAIEPEREVQCLDIAEVTLGKVPHGWKETAPLTVKPGDIYTIQVRGIGSGTLEGASL